MLRKVVAHELQLKAQPLVRLHRSIDGHGCPGHAELGAVHRHDAAIGPEGKSTGQRLSKRRICLEGQVTRTAQQVRGSFGEGEIDRSRDSRSETGRSIVEQPVEKRFRAQSRECSLHSDRSVLRSVHIENGLSGKGLEDEVFQAHVRAIPGEIC